jgi:hypothetical protein
VTFREVLNLAENKEEELLIPRDSITSPDRIIFSVIFPIS